MDAPRGGWSALTDYSLDTLDRALVAAGCLPCQERAAAALASPAYADAGSSPAEGTTGPTWSGTIGVEGEMTGDGRMIEANALRWENLPIPLRYVSEDVGSHDGAQVVGRILTVSRQGGNITATGDFDTDSPVGAEAYRQVSSNLTNGISMDLDDVSFELRIAQDVMDSDAGFPLFLLANDTEPEPPPPDEPPTDADGRVTVMEINADDEVRVTTDARIRAATIVAIPAFATAQIYADASDALATTPPPPPPAPAGGDTPSAGTMPDGSDCSCDEGADGYDPDCDCSASSDGGDDAPADAPAGGPAKKAPPSGGPPKKGTNPFPPAKKAAVTVVAGGRPALVVDPPAAWFASPAFTGATPLRVTADGRVSGHLANWGTCHLSHTAAGKCITAPQSRSGYAYFETGSLLTAEGTEVRVGHITLDTIHASDHMSAAQAAAHYENTGAVVADVAAGEDAWGIWVAGAVRPGTTEAQLRALRAAPLSGDWRQIGANLELVAALSVNVPGFPVPRPAGLVAGGRLTSLVAAGMLAPRRVIPPGLPGALTNDDLRYLKRLADRERAAEAAIRPEALALRRRVQVSAMARRLHHPTTTTGA